MTAHNLCRKCKTELPENAVFCHLCGLRQAAPTRRKRSRPNGLGTAYKRGNKWQAILRKTVVVDGKKVIKKFSKCGFDTRAAALMAAPFLDQAEEDTSERTFQYYWEIYSDGKLLSLSNSKQTAYKIAYAKLDEIHHKRVKGTSIKQLQRIIDEKAPSHYPARDIKVLLSHLYTLALVDEEVSTNPSTLITLPELKEKEGEAFSKKEEAALWKAYEGGDTFVGYILLMMYTGMMPGELFICKKEHIFWDQQYILGCGIKTKKRKTTPIVIADFLVPVLINLCEYSNGPKLLQMSRDKFYEEYYNALDRAGCRRIKPYSGRHTAGTRLDVDHNIAPSVISEVLRQKTRRVQERYQHPDISDALNAVNAMKPQRE